MNEASRCPKRQIGAQREIIRNAQGKARTVVQQNKRHAHERQHRTTLVWIFFVAMLTAHSALTAPDAPASIVLALGDTCTSLRPTKPVSRRRRHRLLPSLSAAAAVPSSRALLMTMPSPIHPALLAPLRLSQARDLLIVGLAVEPHVQGPTLPQRLPL